jgi:hypothetical protein
VCYQLADGTTTAWEQDEILCSGTSTIDELVDGVNFRRAIATSAVLQTLPVALPSSALGELIGSVQIDVTNLTTSYMLSTVFKLAAGPATLAIEIGQIPVANGAPAIVAPTAAYLSLPTGTAVFFNGSLTVDSSGNGSFVALIVPSAALGTGPMNFAIYLGAIDLTAHSVTSAAISAL